MRYVTAGANPMILREGINKAVAAVIEEVKKVRYVKDNTILVNLNDPRYFKRNKNGTYTVA